MRHLPLRGIGDARGLHFPKYDFPAQKNTIILYQYIHTNIRITMEEHLFLLTVFVILVLLLPGCTSTTGNNSIPNIMTDITIPKNDPIIGTWSYSHKDAEGDREITYIFNASGRYDATDFDYSTEHGPHSLGPKYGLWKAEGKNRYSLVDQAGFGGEPPDPFVYSPQNDTITRDGITLVRK